VTVFTFDCRYVFRACILASIWFDFYRYRDVCLEDVNISMYVLTEQRPRELAYLWEKQTLQNKLFEDNT
jgi:hypothetical protein